MNRMICVMVVVAAAMMGGDALSQTYGLGPEIDVASETLPDSFGLGDTSTMPVIKAASARTKASKVERYVSPPGYHRHVLVDGTIIEHHDSNFGRAASHVGVAGANWPKYYGPSPPTVTTKSSSTVYRARDVVYYDQSCPGGVCPAPMAVRRWSLLPRRR